MKLKLLAFQQGATCLASQNGTQCVLCVIGTDTVVQVTLNINATGISDSTGIVTQNGQGCHQTSLVLIVLIFRGIGIESFTVSLLGV